MEIHYKSTIWNRITIPDQVDKEYILDQLKEGIHPLDLDMQGDFNSTFEVMYDTEEIISIEDNNGNSTIELMDDIKGKLGLTCIWDNVEGDK